MAIRLVLFIGFGESAPEYHTSQSDYKRLRELFALKVDLCWVALSIPYRS